MRPALLRAATVKGLIALPAPNAPFRRGRASPSLAGGRRFLLQADAAGAGAGVGLAPAAPWMGHITEPVFSWLWTHRLRAGGNEWGTAAQVEHDSILQGGAGN